MTSCPLILKEGSPNPAPRLAKSPPPVTRPTKVSTAYWLLSTTIINGSFQIAAILIASHVLPVFIPPSPTKPTDTFLSPLCWIPSAAPIAIPTPAPTIPFPPKWPCEIPAKCIEPPRPPETPVDFAINSAITDLGENPFASVW